MDNLLIRTDMCGTLRTTDVGRSVVLNGWVQKSRRLGALTFVDIRDKSGITQVVFNDETEAVLSAKAERLRREFVIGVSGVVATRQSVNNDIPTGEIEVIADSLSVYSEADTPPIYVADDDNVDEDLRLKYRYIDLRKSKMQRNLAFRSEVSRIAREYFAENGFIEVETPILVKPTPEGARDYLVPSRINRGHFYALPQSPQLYKQLLMAGGTDRYVQIAKCFRDEDLRADRQPEFTQIDLEMSFVTQDDVIAIQEGFLKKIMKETKGIDIETPFPRFTYKEAMSRYGSDKPDIRFGFEITDISDLVKDSEFQVFTNAISEGGSVRGINVTGGASAYSRKELDKLTETAREYGAKGLAWIKLAEGQINSTFSKFFDEDGLKKLTAAFEAKDGDLILISSDEDSVVFEVLGRLRLIAAEKLGLTADFDPNSADYYKYLWVVEFPLLEKVDDDTHSGFKAMHHPFTSPNPEDLDLLDTDPGAVRAVAYDIVLNGTELGGGSIRIHDRDLQNRMFGVLGLDEEEIDNKFGFLLEAFRYGVPPHGGLAYGLDRLIMLLLGESSIRDTMAFPKNQAAEDPVSAAPGEVDEVQLAELGLRLK